MGPQTQPSSTAQRWFAPQGGLQWPVVALHDWVPSQLERQPEASVQVHGAPSGLLIAKHAAWL